MEFISSTEKVIMQRSRQSDKKVQILLEPIKSWMVPHTDEYCASKPGKSINQYPVFLSATWRTLFNKVYFLTYFKVSWTSYHCLRCFNSSPEPRLMIKSLRRLSFDNSQIIWRPACNACIKHVNHLQVHLYSWNPTQETFPYISSYCRNISYCESL